MTNYSRYEESMQLTSNNKERKWSAEAAIIRMNLLLNIHMLQYIPILSYHILLNPLFVLLVLMHNQYIGTRACQRKKGNTTRITPPIRSLVRQNIFLISGLLLVQVDNNQVQVDHKQGDYKRQMNSKRSDQKIALFPMSSFTGPSDSSEETGQASIPQFSSADFRSFAEYPKSVQIYTEPEANLIEGDTLNATGNPWYITQKVTPKETMQETREIEGNSALGTVENSLPEGETKRTKSAGGNPPEVTAEKGLTDNSVDGASTFLESVGAKRHRIESRKSCTKSETKENMSYDEPLVKARKRGYSEICEITRHFFGLNWDSSALRRAKQFPSKIIYRNKIDAHFTSAVYWHYINSQYFPVDIFISGRDPGTFFNSVKEKLSAAIPANTFTDSKCIDAIQAIGDRYLSKQASEKTGKTDKNLTVDQMIELEEEKMKDHREVLDTLKSTVGRRIFDALDVDKAVEADSLNLAFNSLDKYMDNLYRVYTKPSLTALTEYAETVKDSDSDLLRDSVYPNGIDHKYIEHMEKKLRKQGGTVLSNPLYKNPSVSIRKKFSSTRGEVINTRSRHRIAFQTQPESKSIPIKLAASHPKQHNTSKFSCQVCNEEYTDPHNRILTCAICHCKTHEQCYGATHVTEKDWVCELCLTGSSSSTPCLLCPNLGGIMKQAVTSTMEGWVHLSCAYWTPEISFRDPQAREPAIGLDRIDPKRLQQACSICGVKGGCCVQCGKGTCSAVFHAECGRLAGLYMEVTVCRSQDAAYKIYCKKHRPLNLMKGVEQGQKRAMDEILNFCRVIEKCYGIQAEPHKRKRRERPFTKADRSRLIKRIRQVCKQSSELTILLEKPETPEDNYKLIPTFFESTYSETLRRGFPWEAVKFGKFSAENCYNEYLRVVPDEDTFEAKVMQRKSKRLTKHSLKRNKLQKLYTDPTPYCICHKTYGQDSTAMIGTLNTLIKPKQNALEASNARITDGSISDVQELKQPRKSQTRWCIIAILASLGCRIPKHPNSLFVTLSILFLVTLINTQVQNTYITFKQYILKTKLQNGIRTT
eukprot:TRINITY_DN2554_c0_g2_i2.p1 TRINITY_DN2554_c0_g2~~TRINITY_DN2554_c0_g2_i2.p1  ORF type:complete len:1044 (+),score=10.20 TRINITY_DN2554_c0_g2_i2:687-3818(+)